MAELPEMIGKYKIDSLVAKGGMGAVYKAIHPSLRRWVILKKLTIRGNAAIIERFKREARILMDFKHNNIVHFFDYFKEGNAHYIVLEYIDGMSLDGLIKKRRFLSSHLALTILLDACKALKFAHDNGVIHRDIKPANILMSKKGDIKLADFGIAASEDETDDGLTKEGMTLGTPSYMPPEQFENTRNVDKRADIYAMGVMLYEMVTGKRPYPGSFAADTIRLIQKGRYTPARKLNPEIAPLASRLIKKMLQPNPARRFQDMGAVIRLIERWLKNYNREAIKATLVDCINTDLKDEPAFRPRLRKRLVLIPAALLALAVGGGAWTLHRSGQLYRWFTPTVYGPVSIRLRLPKTLKDAGDVLLRARVFRNDGQDLPEVTGLDLGFSLEAVDPADPYLSFVSRQLILEPGAYRLKLLAEHRLYWESFQVESFKRLSDSGREDTRLELRFDDVEPRPLRVWHRAVDAVSGQALADGVRLLAQVNGSWVSEEIFARSPRLTDRVWRFRAEADGYYPELFSLLVGAYQDELVIHSNLVPLPGHLSIVDAPERLRLRLNDSDTVIAGGQTISYVSLRDYRGGPADWLLPAGSYRLEASLGSRSVARDLTIRPEGQTRITINLAADGLSINEE
ncbi:MAG: hypothetical protein A2087_14715 [Spirochaetes bacterium GWD1_61_31]|nr:MAG: hypothetical protein A2Y37_12940 [Spirochaetes bacterium GWB1_60_80]OHD28688.1 MAG: hypothetical protein A2004_05890 [Spirochaetes bacterium GWC1_61_12]OHD38890.1 MAG: hypothetical protein A2087_14715 [Spirochaetes bacterium GWD1_61_31]OHD43331.1 MAG: hypothetical protein A2Y35_08635 [Spirochaetes bacterium GWE1_60_18]OHD58869.1 MAG: hypothetical protein A2Y32_09005 [Spirochaetes bacterium GWF1_60_12]HAP42523.1 serine/threonine protein kinase [Spirochaetaceae bacterium]